MSFRNAGLLILTIVLTAGFARYASIHPMDFRVYHYGARGVFDGTRPVYGPSSGLGWPMHYRYPPLFLLLFAPFAWLPLGTAAALWVSLKIVVLILLIRAMAARMPPTGGIALWLVPLLLAGPYVIQDFRYGNAQFFVFALTAMALLLAREKPLVSAASLALGISLKVWPLFFIPYLMVRREWRVVAWSLILTVFLTAAPAAYFGIGGNARLVGQWYRQEFATQTGQEEIWFPSQSLRGVLMRYLTVIDYSQVPDSNYRLVQIAAWNPKVIRALWAAAAGIVYLCFLWLASSRRLADGWIDAGLAFCLLSLLEPFTQKYAMVVLLWPAIVAGRSIAKPAVRNLIYLSIALVLIQPMIPGSTAQRLMQVLGADFAAATALAVGLALAIRIDSASGMKWRLD